MGSVSFPTATGRLSTSWARVAALLEFTMFTFS
ncbi:protein of unknown function (plasmid) [Streptantibioticus cattleyicolor NRRL 8057 = DSM 46488]|nr:protein of unknown function [Streptantibioticus cattleyicolor NRRL 8057 = DSM 46488]